MFNEFGVQIMTPAYEGDPAEPKVAGRLAGRRCAAFGGREQHRLHLAPGRLVADSDLGVKDQALGLGWGDFAVTYELNMYWPIDPGKGRTTTRSRLHGGRWVSELH